MSGWTPALKVEVLNVAVPLLPNGLEPMGEPLSRNVTVPVGVPVAELVTVAMIDMDWPTAAGFGKTAIAMNVGAG